MQPLRAHALGQDVLITGFGPFTTEAGRRIEDNPAAVIAAAAAEEIGAVCRILTVSYELTPAEFALALADVAPLLWVGVGLAASRQTIGVEVVALNVEHGRDDAVRVDAAIDPLGPVARRITFDGAGFVRTQRRSGAPVDLSHHAGTFLCNRVFFDGLGAEARGTLERAAFVHVPPVDVVPADVAVKVVAALVDALRSESALPQS